VYSSVTWMGRGSVSHGVSQVMGGNRKIFALKRIKLQGRDEESAAGFIDEIELLRRLHGKPNIIQLIDAEVAHFVIPMIA
jgi:serine/threonine-protein kinase TTK/MPS1